MSTARLTIAITGLLLAAALVVAGCIEPPPRPEDTEAFKTAAEAIRGHEEVRRRLGEKVSVAINDSGIDDDSAWFRLTISGMGTAGTADANVRKKNGKWEVVNLEAMIGGKQLDLMEESP